MKNYEKNKMQKKRKHHLQQNSGAKISPISSQRKIFNKNKSFQERTPTFTDNVLGYRVLKQ